MKTVLLMNMAPRYVEPAYTLFDKELDILWCFGSNNTDIKEMDHSLLKECIVFPSKFLGERAYYLKGALKLPFLKNVDNYVIIGSPALLTTWIFPWLVKFFHPSRKVLFWTHGWYGKEGKFKTIVKKLYFLPADMILTYGDRARRLMIEVGYNPQKVMAIHNSLNHDAQVSLRNSITITSIYNNHFGNDYPTIIFIGRLTKVKKLDMVIDALAKLKEKGEKYNLVFVGDGTERETLEHKVDSLGLNDSVWFYGACYDEKQNAELIYNADLCVSPGNVGLTAMHALVFGCPVITHDNFPWQMPEFESIKEGITGSFFKQGDVGSLSECISNWFRNKSCQRDIVRQACYDEIDNYWTPEFELAVLKKALKIE